MSDNPNIMHKSFDHFAGLVYPDADQSQLDTIRITFMAGAESYRRILAHAGTINREAVIYVDQCVAEELYDYHEQVGQLLNAGGTPQ